MPIFKIPAVLLINWPDPYYHSNLDRADKADATQLKRVGFITAAAGFTIANAKPEDVLNIGTMMLGKSQERIGEDVKKYSERLLKSDKEKLYDNYKESRIGIEEAYKRENMSLGSLKTFAKDDKNANDLIASFQKSLAKGLDGHLDAVDELYKILCKKYNIKAEKIKLTDAEKQAAKMIPMLTLDDMNIMQMFMGQGKIRGNAGTELLNFCDGKRSILDLRNAVSAEFDPLKIETVIEHFQMLEKSKMVSIKNK